MLSLRVEKSKLAKSFQRTSKCERWLFLLLLRQKSYKLSVACWHPGATR
jgi:hypothetical protein